MRATAKHFNLVKMLKWQQSLILLEVKVVLKKLVQHEYDRYPELYE